MEKNLPNANYSIHIAFHLNASLNASTDAARIGVLLSKIFGEEQVEIIDLDTQDMEIVYRVNKPVLADSSGQQVFFQALQKLLAETEEYHPHFTQIHG